MTLKSKIVRSMAALLMLSQGASLVASCGFPCRMNAQEKLNCVVSCMASLQQDRAQYPTGIIHSRALGCGHLDITAPATLAIQQVQGPSRLLGFPVPAVALPQQSLALASFLISHNKAGPSLAALSQALLPIPPQNAPPVLA